MILSSQFARPAFDLSTYPTDALAWVDQQGGIAPDRRLATEDTTGNVIELVFGDRARVFFDDRFDMYSVELNNDYTKILDLKPGWDAVLDKYEIDAVMWPKNSAVVQALSLKPEWQRTYTDTNAAIFVRRAPVEK